MLSSFHRKTGAALAPFLLSLLSLLASLLLAAAPASGKAVTERSKQKAAAEAARAGLQQKLDGLKRDISKTDKAAQSWLLA